MKYTTKKIKTLDEDDEDNEIGSSGEVSALYDHLYFYAGITQGSALKLNKLLQETSMRLAPSAFSSMQEVGQPSPIWLHINSHGGEVFSSFSVSDTVERISQVIPIVTIVEGCAASGATLISLAGTKRLMRKNAFMLIHELSSVAWGRHSQMEDQMTSNRGMMKTIKDYYKEKTKIPEKELEEILKHDLWWNAKKCLKYGLVDAII